MEQATEIDKKTAAFYLTLLALVVLDVILIVWLLSPFAHLGTHAYASERPAAVNDDAKPSPFDIAESKRGLVQGMRVRPRVAAVSATQSH